MLDLYKIILKALHIQVLQQETKHKTLSRIYENIAFNQSIYELKYSFGFDLISLHYLININNLLFVKRLTSCQFTY